MCNDNNIIAIGQSSMKHFNHLTYKLLFIGKVSKYKKKKESEWIEINLPANGILIRTNENDFYDHNFGINDDRGKWRDDESDRKLERDSGTTKKKNRWEKDLSSVEWIKLLNRCEFCDFFSELKGFTRLPTR